MSTTYNHAQIGIVDIDGNVNVIYPETTGGDVSITANKNAESATNVQSLVDGLGALAFSDGGNLVFLDQAETFEGQVISTEIDDNSVTSTTTWSSENIDGKFSVLTGSVADLNSDVSEMSTSVTELGATVSGMQTGVGTWLPTTIVNSGETTVTIENAAITASSIIDLYYSLTEIEVTEVQNEGSLTITFGVALTEACTINVKVVNLS